jgi:hypothetical protein
LAGLEVILAAPAFDLRRKPAHRDIMRSSSNPFVPSWGRS